MFNLFKSPFPKETKEFAATFTKEQKAAIIGAFVIIVKEEHNFHPNEEKYMESVSNLLHISVEDKIFEISASKGYTYMIQQLKSLTSSQKDWFAVSLDNLLECTGRTKITNSVDALKMLGTIGISEARYKEVVNKAQLLARKYL